MAAAKLGEYAKKRDFTQTAEPSDQSAVAPSQALRFVIQKHAASHLHFDLRLEYDGVFRSWAVPKGPSLDPHDRRLAVQVEDHPLAYGDFEGTIPERQYGGGTVMLWDRGYWAPEAGFEDIGRALDKGELKFVMEGQRMHGSWVLVRTRFEGHGKPNWMLIKHRDVAAQPGDPGGPSSQDKSVASGRTMPQIAEGKGKAASPFMTGAGAKPGAVWRTDKTHPPAAPPEPKATPKPRKTADALPDFIEPQLAKAVDKPPAGPGWAHEIKFDGYRIQMRVQGGKAVLKTRKGLDWSHRFPEIAAAGAGLPDGVFDGEVVALDHTGAPDFGALQGALADGPTKDLVFFVFDQLFDGLEDLRPLSLTERKARLKAALAEAPVNIRYVDHFVTGGDAVLQSACRMHLEGVVSKRLDAAYVSGRDGGWVKSKCRAGHEVVIGGYATTNGAFRSLIVGVNRDGRLIHAGRVGTGFGRDKVARLLPKLTAIETDKSPFFGKTPPRQGGEAHWVRPELVAEIEHEGFTPDGMVRQGAFKALREDKPARDVEAETPAPVATALKQPQPAAVARTSGPAVVMDVTLSHPDKALWPEGGDGAPVTKLDLARYFEAVGEWMLPHLRGRPCSMVRFPDGIEAEERFFQRHVGKGQSSLITAVDVGGERQPYLQFDRVEALIAAAQVGALELHPWNCRPFAPEEPGRLVFDLDPGPDVPFDQVIEGAREVRDRLQDLGLIGFCKTTGGKGLHVVTPIQAKGLDWATVKAFAKGVCQAMAADSPDRYLINMAKDRRGGKIFLDYLRNDRMSTAVAPLSPRGRPGAPVSMPLPWAAVRKGLDPAKFTVRSTPALIEATAAWEDYSEGEKPVAQAIKRLGRT